jgi:hypothetical protein
MAVMKWLRRKREAAKPAIRVKPPVVEETDLQALFALVAMLRTVGLGPNDVGPRWRDVVVAWGDADPSGSRTRYFNQLAYVNGYGVGKPIDKGRAPDQRLRAVAAVLSAVKAAP